MDIRKQKISMHGYPFMISIDMDMSSIIHAFLDIHLDIIWIY